MNEILTDLGDAALTDAMKSNFYGWLLANTQPPLAEVRTWPSLTCWHTAVTGPWYRGILIRQPAADGDRAILREVLDFFTVRDVRALTCWLAVGVATAGWDEVLLELGFTPDVEPQGMAIYLSALSENYPVAGDFHIRVVRDAESFGEWGRTAIAGFGVPVATGQPLVDLIAAAGLELPFRHYTGYLDGKPVATSSLFLGAGVAGVNDVATLPEARRRGIGAAMTAAPLRDAQALGYRAGTLQATDMGLPVYERMGFRKLCDIEHYMWKRPA